MIFIAFWYLLLTTHTSLLKSRAFHCFSLLFYKQIKQFRCKLLKSIDWSCISFEKQMFYVFCVFIDLQCFSKYFHCKNLMIIEFVFLVEIYWFSCVCCRLPLKNIVVYWNVRVFVGIYWVLLTFVDLHFNTLFFIVKSVFFKFSDFHWASLNKHWFLLYITCFCWNLLMFIDSLLNSIEQHWFLLKITCLWLKNLDFHWMFVDFHLKTLMFIEKKEMLDVIDFHWSFPDVRWKTLICIENYVFLFSFIEFHLVFADFHLKTMICIEN